MRTGIGVSLFRGGSDVLFHPRQRQSCRTAKTYHTIVSKFAHSLISRSFSSAISLSSFLFLSRRLFFSFYDGSPAALCISLSSLVLPHHLLFFFSYSSSSSTSRLLLYSSSRDFITLSLVYPVSAEGSRGTRRPSFPPFRLRAGPEDIG